MVSARMTPFPDMLLSPAGFPVAAIAGQGKSGGHQAVLGFLRSLPSLN
jgi:hypothetical protein